MLHEKGFKLAKINLIIVLGLFIGACSTNEVSFVEADHEHIQYTGRVDFTDPKKPKFWAPGVYIEARFEGSFCEVLINDEVLGGDNFNYLEVVVDNEPPRRIQTTGKENRIVVAEGGLSDGPHTITISKNTESGIGYLEFLGFRCRGLLPMSPKPSRKLEFIGNSITCGSGSDLSVIACDSGKWYDQHNAYMSYGPLVARQLNAQWHLSSVSGIGLIRSCCDMGITMPQVFDKVNMRDNIGQWDFDQYQPDAVTICLGQNDGIQDSTAFSEAYVNFIKDVRSYYPNAHIACLTSPMANNALTAALQNYLTGIVKYTHEAGDENVSKFFFSRSYNDGCGDHPSLQEHELIAQELAPYLQEKLGW